MDTPKFYNCQFWPPSFVILAKTLSCGISFCYPPTPLSLGLQVDTLPSGLPIFIVAASVFYGISLPCYTTHFQIINDQGPTLFLLWCLPSLQEVQLFGR